jgi:hypothetical protein
VVKGEQTEWALFVCACCLGDVIVFAAAPAAFFPFLFCNFAP